MRVRPPGAKTRQDGAHLSIGNRNIPVVIPWPSSVHREQETRDRIPSVLVLNCLPVPLQLAFGLNMANFVLQDQGHSQIAVYATYVSVLAFAGNLRVLPRGTQLLFAKTKPITAAMLPSNTEQPSDESIS
jgi:hypothetical protein